MEASEPAAEVEGKLLVPSEPGLDRIARLTRLGRHRLRRRRSQRLHSVYLDTPDFSLTRHGVALRLRRDGTSWEATVKWSGNVDGAVHDRPELNVRLASTPELPFALPEGPLRTYVVVHAMDRPLHPILRTEIRRRRLDVLPASSSSRREPVAEIALDQVTLGSPQDQPFASYAEVEVEARGASRDTVHSLTETLRKRFGLEPSTHSKLAFGLALLYGDVALQPGAPAPLERDDPIATAVRKIVAIQLARLRERDPGVRTGNDPDALHEMRVATRRLRAALRSFRIAIPSRLCDELGGELRWLGSCLGAVRDLDVHLADLDRHAVALPPSYREALEPFRQYVGEERRQKSDALREALDSRRYFQLLAKLETFSTSRPSPDRLPAAAQQPISAFGAAAAEKALRRFWKRGRKTDSAATPEALHKLRIRAKRTRYLLEFLADFCGKPGRRLIRRLIRVQDVLGAFNDAIVIADLVCRYLDRPQALSVPPSTTLALQEFAQGRLRETATLRAKFERSWRRFASKRVHKAARRAIENLTGGRDRGEVSA